MTTPAAFSLGPGTVMKGPDAVSYCRAACFYLFEGRAMPNDEYKAAMLDVADAVASCPDLLSDVSGADARRTGHEILSMYARTAAYMYESGIWGIDQAGLLTAMAERLFERARGEGA